MKVRNIIFVITLISLIASYFVISNIYSEKHNNYIPQSGLIPDGETALKIADAVLLPVYGDSINSKKPFKVKYSKEEDAWIVCGVLPPNTVGGVPSIVISKRDGRILKVSHGL